jgi:CheY-like chemotaxis protein
MKNGVKILVVDDEPVIRHAMRQLLEHCGCEVEAVGDGNAALTSLAERRFDLVITDLSMPGMPGDQLVAKIRQAIPTQRILMATAFAEEYRMFSRHAGTVDGLLLKPFTFRELQDAIEAILDLSTASGLEPIEPLGETSPSAQPRVFSPPETIS